MTEKNKSLMFLGSVVLGAFILGLAMSLLFSVQRPVAVSAQGVTNYDSLHLSDTGGTATPVLRANQDGTGKIAEFLDAGTPVWSLNDGGGVSQSGGLNLNGASLTWDSDADTSSVASVDDVITITLGGATGYEIITTGNFRVGNGSPSTSQDGEDAYIEDGFEVDGTARLDGAVDINNNIDQDGTADEVQLSITGYTTQTNDIVQIDGGLVDIGTGTGGTADGDKDLLVGGDLEVDDTLDVDGDIDLNGDGFDVDITAGFSLDGDAASNVTVAGAGIDLTLESEAGRLILKGDEAAANGVTIDANDATTTGLDIDVGSVSGMTVDGGLLDVGGGTGGTADGDEDLLVAGDVEVDDTLDVDGDIDLNGDGFDVDITAGYSIDGDAASNVTVAGAGFDLTILSDDGSLVLQGDEAIATAVTINANDSVTSGLDVNVGSVSGMSVDGGLLDIGGGTYGTADGDNDIGVDGDIEANGNVVFGTQGLYPLGYASADIEIQCSTTGVFTETIFVTASSLTTATYVLVSQITDPAATGAFLTVTQPTTQSFTVKSWETDATAGTTGVNAFWCAVGNQ